MLMAALRMPGLANCAPAQHVVPLEIVRIPRWNPKHSCLLECRTCRGDVVQRCEHRSLRRRGGWGADAAQPPRSPVRRLYRPVHVSRWAAGCLAGCVGLVGQPLAVRTWPAPNPLLTAPFCCARCALWRLLACRWQTGAWREQGATSTAVPYKPTLASTRAGCWQLLGGEARARCSPPGRQHACKRACKLSKPFCLPPSLLQSPRTPAPLPITKTAACWAHGRPLYGPNGVSS